MKWTKRDIKSMRQAIASWWLCNRPCDGRRSEELEKRAGEVLANPENRKKIVVGGIRQLIEITRERLEGHTGYRATAANYKRPEWNGSMDELVTRFEGFAREAERDIAKGEAFIARIEAEVLPPEVLEFDPVAARAIA